jgi:dTDP-glucose 4,6-dehydratase
MIIAVTGSAGYIGGWLLAELASRGHEVHSQDINSVPGLPDGVAPPWVFDLKDGIRRQAWLKSASPDVVIHLAALYGRVWGEADLIKTAADNAGLTAALARDVAAIGARLVLASSSEVYGQSADGSTVYPETPLRPMNMYGMTKKWSEEAAWLYAPRGLVVARLNMPYGPSQMPPTPGTIPATSCKVGPVGYHALHTMLWQASHGMDIVVHKGTSRCFTWAGDMVQGMAAVIESGNSGTWNIGRNDDHYLMSEVARRAVAMAGSSSSIREVEVPSRVTAQKSLGNASLLSLGWQPGMPFGKGMEASFHYFSKFDKDGVWRG